MQIRTAGKTLIINGQPMAAEAIRALLGQPLADPGNEQSLAPLAEKLAAAGFDARVDEPSEGMIRAGSVRTEQATTLLDAMGEGVCLSDHQGRVLWANAFFHRLDAPTRAIIEQRLRQFGRAYGEAGVCGICTTPEEIMKARRRCEVTSPETGVIYELEVTPAPPRSDAEGDIGERVEDHGEASGRAAIDGPDRLAGVVRDVTEARQTAAKLHAIERAGNELVRIDADAVRTKTAHERLKLMEDRIVRLTHDVLRYDHFAIFLIDESRERLELVISEGLPPEIQDLELSAETEGSGITGYVAATGRSYICRDTESDERFLPGLAGARSSLTVPLLLHDRTIGIMDVESQQAEAFDEVDRQFLEIFGRHIALALHMLDLLVVERSTTNQTVSGRVGDEIRDPLDDIIEHLDRMRESEVNPEALKHIDGIRADVASIRERVENVAAGPQTLLGVERALAACEIDPLLHNRRVLVADDEARVRKLISAVLRARGADVTVAECGQAAIDMLGEIAGGRREPFDLVVSDIRMPDRNGYEVFSAARRVSDTLPVILMTGFGYDPHHSIVRASQQGLQSVLFKPFDIERLLDEAHKALAVQADA